MGYIEGSTIWLDRESREYHTSHRLSYVYLYQSLYAGRILYLEQVYQTPEPKMPDLSIKKRFVNVVEDSLSLRASAPHVNHGDLPMKPTSHQYGSNLILSF